MLIGGRAVRAEATLDVVDPATGRVFAQAPECTPVQLDDAFQAAQAAGTAWQADEALRREVLRAAAETLVRSSGTLARLITAEQGKPLADASLEVMATAAWLGYFADLPLPHEVVRSNARVRIDVSRRPVGVVAAMTPWNYPLMLAAWKLGPALLAGNTVVLKPSPLSPLSALLLGELLSTVVPPGVLNVVSGGAGTGARMIAHPVPRMVSFTGSVAVGRQVAVEAARGLKRVVLELGGNDAAIVLDDADVDVVAEGLFWGAFQNNGQVCSAIKRVYAPDHLVDELAKSVAEVAARVEIGPGTERGSQLGPLGNRGQFERVTDLVDEAVAGGARAVVGGRPLQREGFFFPPTILTGAADDSRIVAEEQFGPVLPILGYRDLDDAVRRANATEFGLSGSVWGESSERAAEVAARLECGTAWVNTHLVLLPEQPFGGTKWSGMGIENGHWGVDAFSNLQVVHCLHS